MGLRDGVRVGRLSLQQAVVPRRLAEGTHEVLPFGLAPLEYDDVVDAIPQPAFVFDAHGMIVQANPLAETLAGYARGTLVGEIATRIVGPLDPIEVRRHARFIPTSDGSFIRHIGGGYLPAGLLLCPHTHGAILVIVYPVPDDLRAQDIEQVVHDLKGPLSTIALEAFLLEANGITPPDLPRVATRISQNVFYLDRMVQDLLDSCSIETGRLEIQRTSTELRSLLEQVLERAVPSRDRGRVLLEAPARLTLNLDQLRIERVVANLLGNALKYATQGIVVRLEPHLDGCRISVIDAGPGLTDEEVHHVFDRYRRGASSHGHSGSGLGLFVSKEIVEAHGGSIGVESVHGQGARFYFELPSG